MDKIQIIVLARKHRMQIHNLQQMIELSLHRSITFFFKYSRSYRIHLNHHKLLIHSFISNSALLIY